MRYSLLIPFYNEEKQIALTLETVRPIMQSLGDDFEILAIDDGSKDQTWAQLQQMKSSCPELRALRFSRNFGKEAAVTAALEEARGDAVILIDGDLQHPPELIPEMARLWREENYEVIEAVKTDRGKESAISRFAANSFYRLFAGAGDIQLKNASDFKLLDRKVVDALNQMQERGTFFRGMSAWVGFKRTSLPFVVADRQTGHSKWNLANKMRLTLNAITAFSSKPLEILLYIGILFLCGGAILFVQTLITFFTRHAASGFTTVILLLLILGGLILIALGIIGLYIARIYDEVKARPRFIITERID